MEVSSRYTEFAIREARGVSPAYERLSLAVARDARILALLETVPAAKQQPNLLLGVVRLLGGPVDDPAAFHDFTVANWPAVRAGLGSRATQTNEAGRCALLLPVLASLPQPLALVEVGAAAAIAAAAPPLLIRGDLVDDLTGLVDRAPAGATVVVFHTSVLYQVPALRRAAFVDLVRGVPGHWISVEGPDVLPWPGLPAPPGPALHNVLALDGRPLAWTRGHGQAMAWFG